MIIQKSYYYTRITNTGYLLVTSWLLEVLFGKETKYFEMFFLQCRPVVMVQTLTSRYNHSSVFSSRDFDLIVVAVVVIIVDIAYIVMTFDNI